MELQNKLQSWMQINKMFFIEKYFKALISE